MPLALPPFAKEPHSSAYQQRMRFLAQIPGLPRTAEEELRLVPQDVRRVLHDYAEEHDRLARKNQSRGADLAFRIFREWVWHYARSGTFGEEARAWARQFTAQNLPRGPGERLRAFAGSEAAPLP